MIAVLYDLHRADGILQTKGLNYGHDDEVAFYYASVLEKHHVTQAQFDSSLVWYTDNPKRFSRIYPVVISKLTQDVEAMTEPDGVRPLAEFGLEEKLPVKTKTRPSLDSLILEMREGVMPPVVIQTPTLTLNPDSLWLIGDAL